MFHDTVFIQKIGMKIQLTNDISASKNIGLKFNSL